MSAVRLRWERLIECDRWLFDRIVESPHKTFFYARSLRDEGDEGDEEMEEAARYW